MISSGIHSKEATGSFKDSNDSLKDSLKDSPNAYLQDPCGSGWVFLDVDGMSMGSIRFLEGRKSSCARCPRAGLAFIHEDKYLPVWIHPSQLLVDFGFLFGFFLEVVN